VRWLFRKPRGDELIREALLLSQARKEKRQRSATNRSGKAQPVTPDSTHRSAQNERTLYIQKNFSESHSESLSSTQKQREKTNPESIKEKSGKDLKEKDSEELPRFVNNWNGICTECNEPTLAWLPTDVNGLATRLLEVIRHLRLSELSDDELSKRLRLLCGKRSISVFARIGSRFSEYNADGLLIETFAKHGPRVWRAVEAELSQLATKPLCVPKLPVPSFSIGEKTA
jgi:hypothetical protein